MGWKAGGFRLTVRSGTHDHWQNFFVAFKRNGEGVGIFGKEGYDGNDIYANVHGSCSCSTALPHLSSRWARRKALLDGGHWDGDGWSIFLPECKKSMRCEGLLDGLKLIHMARGTCDVSSYDVISMAMAVVRMMDYGFTSGFLNRTFLLRC